MNYFVFNKSLDYKRGFSENCMITENGIQLSTQMVQGIFFSRVLDSKESETIWHRMTYQTPEGKSQLHFFFYSGEKNSIIMGQELKDIEELIKDSTISVKEKKRIFSPYLRKESINEPDILLHDVKGRYFWFCVELHLGQEEIARLEAMFVYFPKKTWMNYLPSVYQKEEKSLAFLERFLGVFQSIYDDLDRKIETSANLFEPYTTQKDFLYFMAALIDFDNLYLWEEDRLRKFLVKSNEIYKKRGTRKGLLELTTLFLGEKPFIIEEWQTRPYRNNPEKKELLEKFYGSCENTVTILIKEEYLKGRESDVVLNVIKESIPAHMKINLVALRELLLLGEYTYLGINSKLSYYSPMKLDGLSLLPFTTISKE